MDGIRELLLNNEIAFQEIDWIAYWISARD